MSEVLKTMQYNRSSVPSHQLRDRSMKACATSMIRQLSADLRSKRISAEEITSKYLDTINRLEPSIGAFISVASEEAMQQARQLDARIAKDGTESLSLLSGIPIGIKDNILTHGIRTTAGSQILRDFVPTSDATAVSRLKQSGAILIGKTNMDEFGMGSSTENSSFHPTRNPRDITRVPGGSSGGSAAAVAASQCVASLGSDTGGSIRQPAHFCGVVGLKPTYGRVSRSGLIAYASSLDIIGPMANSVEDAAILLQSIAGSDPLDSTSSSAPVPDYHSHLSTTMTSSRPLEGKRIGLVKQTLGEGVDASVEAAVRKAAKHLESLGAIVEEVSLKSFDAGLPAYYVLAVSEASSNLSRYDGVRYGQRSIGDSLSQLYRGSRGQGFGSEVKKRILMGTYALSAGYYDAYYKRAQQVRAMIREDMVASLGTYDALISPTAPTPAFLLGEKATDPLAMYKGDLMTVNVNLAGLPAIVVPCGSVEVGGDGKVQLPVGLQIIGRSFGEKEIIEIAYAFEQSYQ